MLRSYIILFLVLPLMCKGVETNAYEIQRPINHLFFKQSHFPYVISGGGEHFSITLDSFSDEEKLQYESLLSSSAFGVTTTNIDPGSGNPIPPVGLYPHRLLPYYWNVVGGTEFPVSKQDLDLQYDIVEELSLFGFSSNYKMLHFINSCTSLKRLCLPYNSEPLLLDESLMLSSELEELIVYNASISIWFIEKLKPLKKLEKLILESCYFPLNPTKVGNLNDLSSIKELVILRGDQRLQSSLISGKNSSLEALMIDGAQFTELYYEIRKFRSEKGQKNSLFRNRFPNLKKLEVDFYSDYSNSYAKLSRLIVQELERFEEDGGEGVINYRPFSGLKQMGWPDDENVRKNLNLLRKDGGEPFTVLPSVPKSQSEGGSGMNRRDR